MHINSECVEGVESSVSCIRSISDERNNKKKICVESFTTHFSSYQAWLKNVICDAIQEQFIVNSASYSVYNYVNNKLLDVMKRTRRRRRHLGVSSNCSLGRNVFNNIWLILFSWMLILPVHGYIGVLHRSDGQESTVLSVEGVAGENSFLSCPLSPRAPGDTPKLVLWYMASDNTPIYSHDSRSKQLSNSFQYYGESREEEQIHHKAYHKQGSSAFKGLKSKGHKEGLELNISPQSATLTVKHTTPKDAGLYECRVDFFRSPSQTSFVNLTVIEPPALLEVVDENGLEPSGGYLGPYKEGDSIRLLCTAKYGNPPPSVTWILNGEETLDDTPEETDPSAVTNVLEVPELSRSWSNATLTCLAVNSDLVEPVTKTFMFNVKLLPLSVIVSGPQLATAGTEMVFRCSSDGSEPPAALTWRVNGQDVKGLSTQYGPVSSSTLVLNATRHDDQAEVRCDATNPSVPDYFIYNTTTITVRYPPVLEASLGKEINSSSIKEDVDVYFSCKVSANPPVGAVTWYHENERQVHDVSEGVILAGKELVLQRVTKDRTGNYHCEAANALGQVASEPVYLKVKYLPECQSRAVTYFIYSDPITVTCSFASYPPVFRITWHWNTSSDVNSSKPVERLQKLESSPTNGDGDLSSAELTVEPSMTSEDRELTCRGANELGNQTKTCKFFIKRAKMPAPLSSCRLANITASSLSLTCERPDIPAAGVTAYTAHVYLENGTLFANLTSPQPSFNVSHLDQGTNYHIKVYVSQGPITSQPVLVSASTSRDGVREKIVTLSSSAPSNISVLAMVMGALATFLLLLIVVVVRHRFCFRSRGRGLSSSDSNRISSGAFDNSSMGVVQVVPQTGAGVSTQRSATHSGINDHLQDDDDEDDDESPSLDDVNPDVVPSREETIDLLPNDSPLAQSYYVRCPGQSVRTTLSTRINSALNTEEFHPMLPGGDEEPPGNLGDPNRPTYVDEREAEGDVGVRYNVGVSIGGMGQTVTSLFRSRSRTQNLASLLGRDSSDHETIV